MAVAGCTGLRVGDDDRLARGRLGQDHDLLAHKDGLVNIVGDDEGGQVALRPQFQGEALQILASQGVECAKRLVHQQQIGVEDQGAGNGCALALAARNPVGVLPGHMPDAQALQPVIDPLLPVVKGLIQRGMLTIRPVKAANIQPQGGIIPDRGPGEQAVILQNQAGLRAGPADRLLVDQEVAAAGLAQPGDEVEQGAFAAAARPDDGPHLAPPDLPGEILKDNRPARVDEGHVAEIDNSFGWISHAA